MNWNGLQLNKKFPQIPCLSQIEEIKEELKNRKKKDISIFLPFNYLYENDPLPHNWDVTSDSISIFFAKIFGLDQCFLIKDIDGIYDTQNHLINEISFKDYLEYIRLDKIANIDCNLLIKKKSSPIDLYALKLIEEFKTNCYILNGISLKLRIIEFFSKLSDKDKFYTKIYC